VEAGGSNPLTPTNQFKQLQQSQGIYSGSALAWPSIDCKNLRFSAKQVIAMFVKAMQQLALLYV
jgi:hypothetical protein